LTDRDADQTLKVKKKNEAKGAGRISSRIYTQLRTLHEVDCRRGEA